MGVVQPQSHQAHRDPLLTSSVGHREVKLSLPLWAESQAACLQGHQMARLQCSAPGGIVVFSPQQQHQGREGLSPL